MYFKLFYERARNLIFDPVNEWEKIKNENARSEHISFFFAIPVFIAISVSYLLGKLWETSYFSNYDNVYIITDLLFQFSVPLIVLYLLNYLLIYINQGFQVPVDRSRDFRYLFFSLIPVYLYFIFSGLIPRLDNVLLLIGLLSVYLLWAGAKIMMEISSEKIVPYVVTVIIAYMLIQKVVSEIFKNLLHYIGNQISPLT